MKVSILCIFLLAAHGLASPGREKRQYELPLAIWSTGKIVEVLLHPIKAGEEITASNREYVIGLELELAEFKKLITETEFANITTTFDSNPVYSKENAMKNDQDVDSLKLNGSEAAAAQYRKALKEILALKQDGTASIECLKKLNGATVDFLVSNGAMNNLIGRLSKKVVGQ